jgi:hypothetical protein
MCCVVVSLSTGHLLDSTFSGSTLLDSTLLDSTINPPKTDSTQGVGAAAETLLTMPAKYRVTQETTSQLADTDTGVWSSAISPRTWTAQDLRRDPGERDRPEYAPRRPHPVKNIRILVEDDGAITVINDGDGLPTG